MSPDPAAGLLRSPRVRVVCLAYGLAALAWWVVARAVVPPVIAAAYEGRSVALANRVFQGRTHHPVAHYLDLWSDLAGAVLGGGGVHLALVLLLAAKTRPVAGAGAGRTVLLLRPALALYAAGFLLVTVLSGARHDYVAFLDIWRTVLRGGDPWSVHPDFGYSLNAYGPLFNAFAPLARLNPLGPKLCFAAAYLAYFIGSVADQFAQRAPSRRVLVWLASPFFWVEVAYFGHFDLLVALACVGAVRRRLAGEDVRSGLALAAGVLLKYIPLTLLPFLAWGERRVRWRLAGSAALAIGVGLLVSQAVWGPTVVRPLGFAATRGSNLASVFRFLRGTHSPLRWVTASPDLDPYNVPVLAAGVAAAWVVCRRVRAAPDTGAVVGVLSTLLLYQVGFPQYQALAFLLLIGWAARRREGLAGRALPGLAIDLYLGWFTLFDVVYALAGGVLHPGDPLAWLDEWSGLPTFLLGSFLLGALLAFEANREHPRLSGSRR